MKILAFETSCDDTSIALFENDKLISMYTKSQIHIHTLTGGVVPEVASREHANVIFDVLDTVLTDANTKLKDIDYIAVTTEPGLIPSLLTGITVAKTLAHILRIPLVPINHIEAHIFSNYLERKQEDILFPLVCLTVSGGHNEIWYMQDMWKKEKLGQSQDDAAGEAYDKVAKMMGLGYPGGPIISQLAEDYDSQRPVSGDRSQKALFPRVFLDKTSFAFSFSGLKSAVRREIELRTHKGTSVPIALSDADKKEIAYEFQSAINEVLAFKILTCAQEKGVKTILLAGGVSANDNLRERIQVKAKQQAIDFLFPVKKLYCMDNAAMVGILAYYKILYKKY